MGIQARSANAFPFRKKRQRSSPAQLNILEEQFLINPMPSHMARVELALRLNMTPRRVQVWFQNKRAKVRRAIRNGELVSVQLPESDGEDN
ncbi:MAG: homeobox domain-containing protein [archaeon]|nr:homeobox domain-containing protein [archaeon]